MKKYSLLSISMLLLSYQLFAQEIDSVLVCDVKFHNSEFDNAHAGSGFLLEYEGKVYGITAKHVLFFAKTEDMKTISFGEGRLKTWNFQSKSDTTKAITASRLLNEDPKEPLDFTKIVERDWLIFEIEGEIPESMAIYKLRETALAEGEQLRFLGFPYKGGNGIKPLKINGTLIGFTELGNLKMEVPAAHYNGCSGGPVIDQEGRLVGIVSMGYYNEKTGDNVFEPASTEYFLKVISNITSQN